MENFTAIPCITVLVYLIAEIFKAVTKEKLNKYVPIICGLCGAITGIVIFFVLPELLPEKNFFGATATGIISGFSATGVNQVYKQISDGDEE